jgi:hypothetical protein
MNIIKPIGKGDLPTCEQLLRFALVLPFVSSMMQA